MKGLTYEQTVRLLTLRHEYNLEYEVTFYSQGEGILAVAPCSDVFMWGCADDEHIDNDKDIDAIEARVSGDKNYKEISEQILLWVCEKRGMRPQGAAYGLFNEKHWPELNKYPERETGFGNPYKPGEYNPDK